LKVRFEEFWAEAKLVKDVLLSKSGKELDELLKKLSKIADKLCPAPIDSAAAADSDEPFAPA
jgi:ribosomal protein L12E/L44/L45/RPP1/RPP2